MGVTNYILTVPECDSSGRSIFNELTDYINCLSRVGRYNFQLELAVVLITISAEW